MSNATITQPLALLSSLVAKIENLRDKLGWSDVRDALKKEGFAAGHGWGSLKEKLKESTNADLSKVKTILDGLNRDVVCAGTKELFVIELEDDDVTALQIQLSALSVGSNIYAGRFPLALGANDLLGQNDGYQLAGKVERENGDISIILCARRTQEKQERYDYSAVTGVVQSAFVGVDEFITITRSPYQIFDVLTFRPGLRRLEVLIDYPGRIHKPEFAQERFIRVLQKLVPSVNELTRFFEENAPVNFYPAINGLYSDKREGRVTKLSCRLPTGPVVRQAMASNEDMRNEKFHVAGVTAVGAITPNQVTVVWDSVLNVPGAIEINVGAPVSVVSTFGAIVSSARLVNIRSDAGVVVAVNKLMKYL